MATLSRSLASDLRLLPYDLQVNRAWAEALQQLGILTETERRALDRACDTLARETPDLQQGDEDIHSYVERRLTELAGEAGAKVHTGRSRNDQVATDLRLYLKATLPALRHQVRDVMHALAAQAEAHQETLLPGYTHLQQAQPIVLAHYLLSAATVLRGDDRRLAQAGAALDQCPLGSGALAGSAYPIDRRAVAARLGFGDITPNSLAAVSMRDECLDVATACATIMIHLSRYAEDWILWSGQEFGFVTFADAVTTGSSMMPQKKNPDALELIRGKTARVLGEMQVLFTLLKGLPLSYARDLQEDKPALFDCLDQTGQCLAVFAECLRGATFHADRMRQALDPGLFATELADYLVARDVSFRQAHEIVGQIVRTCATSGTPLSRLAPADFARFAPQFGADVIACFDPARALARRNLAGGTGPASVGAQLADLRMWLRQQTPPPGDAGC